MLARFQHLSNESSSFRFLETQMALAIPSFRADFFIFFGCQKFCKALQPISIVTLDRSLHNHFRTQKKIDHFGPKTILQGHFEEHRDTFANMGYTNLQESTSWLSAPRSTKQLQKSWLCCRWHGCYQHQLPATRIRVEFLKPPVDHSKNILQNQRGNNWSIWGIIGE